MATYYLNSLQFIMILLLLILRFSSITLSSFALLYTFLESDRYQFSSAYLPPQLCVAILLVPGVIALYDFFWGQVRSPLTLPPLQRFLLPPLRLLQILGFSALGFRLLYCELNAKDYVINHYLFSLRRLWTPEELVDQAAPILIQWQGSIPPSAEILFLARQAAPSAENFHRDLQSRLEIMATALESSYNQFSGALYQWGLDHPFVVSSLIILSFLTFIGFIVSFFPETPPPSCPPEILEKLTAIQIQLQTLSDTAVTNSQHGEDLLGLSKRYLQLQERINDLTVQATENQQLLTEISEELAAQTEAFNIWEDGHEGFLSGMSQNLMTLGNQTKNQQELIENLTSRIESCEKKLRDQAEQMEAVVEEAATTSEWLEPFLTFTPTGVSGLGTQAMVRLMRVFHQHLSGVGSIAQAMEVLPPEKLEIFKKFIGSLSDEKREAFENFLRRRSKSE